MSRAAFVALPAALLFATADPAAAARSIVGRGDEVGGVPISHAVAKAGETFNGPLAPFASIEKAAIDDAARVTFLAYELSSAGGQGIYRVFTDNPATGAPSPLYAAHPFNTGND